MTTENTFETMGANALSNVDETLEDIKENQERENPYKLTQALLDEGFIFEWYEVKTPDLSLIMKESMCLLKHTIKA